MRPTIALYDIKKDKLTVREMTDEEYAEALEEQKLIDARAEEIAKAEAARQSALSKLTALGLTEDEIKAIAG